MSAKSRREHENLLGYLQLLEHDNAIMRNLLTEIRDELRKQRSERAKPAYADLIAKQAEQAQALREQLAALGGRIEATEAATGRAVNKAASAGARKGKPGPEPRPIADVIAESVGMDKRAESIASLSLAVDKLADHVKEIVDVLGGLGQRFFEAGDAGHQHVNELAVLLEDSKRQLAAFADLFEQRCKALKVAHGDLRSSVGCSSEGSDRSGLSGPFRSTPDAAIHGTLARLADLIGDDYTVSVTYSPKKWVES
jgi:hypothetical protein